MSLLTFADPDKLLERVVARMERFVSMHDAVYLFASGGRDSALLLLAASYLPNYLRRRIIVVYTEIVENTHLLNVEQVYRLVANLLPEAMHSKIVVIATRINSVRIASYRISPPGFIHIRAWNHDYEGKTFLATLEMLGLGVVRAEQARGPLNQRWCMLLFKHKWWQELRAFKGVRPIIVGVKRSDSVGRERRWRDVDPSMPVKIFETSTARDVALAPLVDLTSVEVSTLLKRYNIVLETYERYGDSLNCMFCPLRSKDKIAGCVEAMPTWFAKQLYNALRNLRSQSTFVKQVLDRWLPYLEKKVGGGR